VSAVLTVTLKVLVAMPVLKVEYTEVWLSHTVPLESRLVPFGDPLMTRIVYGVCPVPGKLKVVDCVSAGLGFTKNVVGQTVYAGSRTRTIRNQMYLPERPFNPIVKL
jgi:hypothetical protein